MVPKKCRHAAAASPARFVKRSVMIAPEVDAALRDISGNRDYSQLVNEALLLYVQARGIDRIVAELEAVNGPISAEVMAEVDRRLEEAHRRAERRARLRS
jgi:hypothetical protein